MRSGCNFDIVLFVRYSNHRYPDDVCSTSCVATKKDSLATGPEERKSEFERWDCDRALFWQ
jgi:hypothetical protein